MAEARALPGPLDMGIEPDAHQAPGHLVGEFRIVAGGDPHAADRQSRHLGDAEDAILPERRGERRGDGGAVELLAQIVDQHDRRDLPELGGDALAPFLVVASLGHDGCAGAGENRGDRVDHQRRAGAGRRLLDQMQRGRPIDHGAQEAEQQERHGMGMFGWRHEGKVAQKVIANERPGGRDLFRRWALRNRGHLEAGRRGIEKPGIRMIAGRRSAACRCGRTPAC